MEDKAIVDLYWARKEQAIAETDKKYGKYCRDISYNILMNREDAEERVNDTYLRAWNSMPPKRPENLRTFLGKIVRNLSLDQWRYQNAEKRKHEVTIALEEMAQCIPSDFCVEQKIEEKELGKLIDRFLWTLPDEQRRIFVRRYFYVEPVLEISRNFGFSLGKVKSMLYRTRTELKHYLMEAGAYHEC